MKKKNGQRMPFWLPLYEDATFLERLGVHVFAAHDSASYRRKQLLPRLPAGGTRTLMKMQQPERTVL